MSKQHIVDLVCERLKINESHMADLLGVTRAAISHKKRRKQNFQTTEIEALLAYAQRERKRLTPYDFFPRARRRRARQ